MNLEKPTQEEFIWPPPAPNLLHAARDTFREWLMNGGGSCPAKDIAQMAYSLFRMTVESEHIKAREEIEKAYQQANRYWAKLMKSQEELGLEKRKAKG